MARNRRTTPVERLAAHRKSASFWRRMLRLSTTDEQVDHAATRLWTWKRRTADAEARLKTVAS